MNDMLSGECIPNEWNESRVVLVHKGGSCFDLPGLLNIESYEPSLFS